MRSKLAVAATLAWSACSSTLSTPPAGHATSGPSESPIAHVVFIIQENRSFNNLFLGYPGATTADSGYDSSGRKVHVRPLELWATWDPGHAARDFFAACDGKGKLRGTKCAMDGWNREYRPPNAPPDVAYSYVPRSEIEPYWALARQYVLSDHTFTSNLDGSFVAHQYAVAAYAGGAVDYPAGAWGCEGGKGDMIPTLLQDRRMGPPVTACFDSPSIASEADAAGIGWRFYADSLSGSGGLWSSYQANRKIFDGPDWNEHVINPSSQFLTDVANGRLAAITWITPTFATSDHPSPDARYGPAWIASVVNAIGTSRFWKSTAIFIMWDDWGGWFDPVPPVHEDYDGLGFRVPLLIASPYAKRGSVTHVQYETAGVLRYIEDNFGLPTLAASDARANDPANDPAVFDYQQQPRRFEKIRGEKPRPYWTQLEQSARPKREAGVTDGD
ncbi:MAG TPA: alkaline phosphatase family protein [Candidatus Nitrosotalea sp.]|nr:alkaline phosphatase family protein [Candidatus Nitrosotalea sp.]